ncbi:OAM dimerization domain-containing protein [Nocardioides sp. YIM B13467]|uniref:OAM dimerization domain-containing protein n=1 Tax=Nocardioides sp. YIM B13467 TaxID=3366294 RepID=UPI00366EADF3
MSIIRPYGDTTGDGMVQVSFTLPIKHSKVADGAALQLANKMGMEPAMVVHSKPMGDDFTFFVVYGQVNHLVDTDKVQVVERDFPLLTPKEANAVIKETLRRPMVVVGACIGTDAHTVGIDAILNIKGFAGEKGLEYYKEIEVVNLGAQVSVPSLVEAAVTRRADAVLVRRWRLRRHRQARPGRVDVRRGASRADRHHHAPADRRPRTPLHRGGRGQHRPPPRARGRRRRPRGDRPLRP